MTPATAILSKIEVLMCFAPRILTKIHVVNTENEAEGHTELNESKPAIFR